MSLRERLARWWAHRKLHRGQCEWCGTVLPDDAEKIDGLSRACSQECATELWVSKTA